MFFSPFIPSKQNAPLKSLLTTSTAHIFTSFFKPTKCEKFRTRFTEAFREFRGDGEKNSRRIFLIKLNVFCYLPSKKKRFVLQHGNKHIFFPRPLHHLVVHDGYLIIIFPHLACEACAKEWKKWNPLRFHVTLSGKKSFPLSCFYFYLKHFTKPLGRRKKKHKNAKGLSPCMEKMQKREKVFFSVDVQRM